MAHQDDATVADHAMSLVGLPPRYRPAIAPIVVNGVTDERRRRTRALERDAATGPRTAPDGRAVRVIAGGAEPDVERLRLLLDAEFAVGHGQRVTNRDATVEQHRAYIDMLSRQEAGLASTRALHEQMVSVIEEAGAKTLGEALGGGAR
ncbi:MAG TPA: hypothetical protein VF288_10600 [Mycobacteriales bacterium]